MLRYALPVILLLSGLLSCRADSDAVLLSGEPVSAEAPSAEAAASEPIHPDFDFRRGEMEVRLTDLPREARESPVVFLNLVAEMLEDDPAILPLVDKSHPLGETFIPGDLVSLDRNPALVTGRQGLQLRQVAVDSLEKMTLAAAEEGLTLKISSAYRSWEYQAALFRRYAERDGEEAASRYSARPGSSQHQLGTTVDFGDITNAFADSPEGLWLAENGWRYGWSLSYPRSGESETGYMWESWHWRYLGIPAAEMQRRFFSDSQQSMLEFWHANMETLAGARK